MLYNKTLKGLGHSRPAMFFFFRKKKNTFEILYLCDYLELEGKQTIWKHVLIEFSSFFRVLGSATHSISVTVARETTHDIRLILDYSE